LRYLCGGEGVEPSQAKGIIKKPEPLPPYYHKTLLTPT